MAGLGRCGVNLARARVRSTLSNRQTSNISRRFSIQLAPVPLFCPAAPPVQSHRFWSEEHSAALPASRLASISHLQSIIVIFSSPSKRSSLTPGHRPPNHLSSTPFQPSANFCSCAIAICFIFYIYATPFFLSNTALVSRQFKYPQLHSLVDQLRLAAFEQFPIPSKALELFVSPGKSRDTDSSPSPTLETTAVGD